jgi:hypothetical protein
MVVGFKVEEKNIVLARDWLYTRSEDHPACIRRQAYGNIDE